MEPMKFPRLPRFLASAAKLSLTLLAGGAPRRPVPVVAPQAPCAPTVVPASVGKGFGTRRMLKTGINEWVAEKSEVQLRQIGAADQNELIAVLTRGNVSRE